MKIWLVRIGEPLPVGGRDARLMRTGLIAEELSRRGHDVVWWSSTFDHYLKRQVAAPGSYSVSSGIQLELLPGSGYRKNFSIQRFVDHAGLARAFSREANLRSPPDLIFTSLPPVDLAAAAVNYGVARGCPVVVDIRDQWPDVFVRYLPQKIQAIAKVLMAPLERQTRHTLTNAEAITAINVPFLQWALRYAGRKPQAKDGVFPLARMKTTSTGESIREAQLFWDKYEVPRDGIVGVFIGTMRAQVDLSHVIEVARRFSLENKPITFVLAGEGERRSLYRQAAKGLANVVLPGWVDNAQVEVLLQRATFGLTPYRTTPDFRASIPNKPIEYFSAGLPVLSTLQGALAVAIEREGCGITYPENDAVGLASAISGLIENRKLQESMSRAAEEFFVRHFDATKVYGDLADQLAQMAMY